MYIMHYTASQHEKICMDDEPAWTPPDLLPDAAALNILSSLNGALESAESRLQTNLGVLIERLDRLDLFLQNLNMDERLRRLEEHDFPPISDYTSSSAHESSSGSPVETGSESVRSSENKTRISTHLPIPPRKRTRE